MTEKRFVHVCKHCGSNELIFDASAWWDAEEQKWEFELNDGRPYCFDCDGETRDEEKDYDTWKATRLLGA